MYPQGNNNESASTLNTIAKRIEVAINGISEARSTAMVIADQAFGGQPETASGGAGKLTPTPSTKLGEIMQQLDYLDRAVSDINSEVRRFNQL